ncbi:hypothetical protein WJ968_30660 [Achromobacter xylosoxidans]
MPSPVCQPENSLPELPCGALMPALPVVSLPLMISAAAPVNVSELPP